MSLFRCSARYQNELSVDEIAATILNEESISIGGHYTDFGFVVQREEQAIYEQLHELAKGNDGAVDEIKRLLVSALDGVAQDFEITISE